MGHLVHSLKLSNILLENGGFHISIFYWGTTSYPVLIFPYIFPKKHLHQPFGVAAGSPMTLGNLHVAGSKSMLRPRRSKSFPRWGSVFNLKCSDSGVADQTWVVELNISFIISLSIYIYALFFVRKKQQRFFAWLKSTWCCTHSDATNRKEVISLFRASGDAWHLCSHTVGRREPRS